MEGEVEGVTALPANKVAIKQALSQLGRGSAGVFGERGAKKTKEGFYFFVRKPRSVRNGGWRERTGNFSGTASVRFSRTDTLSPLRRGCKSASSFVRESGTGAFLSQKESFLAPTAAPGR